MDLKRVILVCVFLSSSAYAVDAQQVCVDAAANKYPFADAKQREQLNENCGTFAKNSGFIQSCIGAQLKAYPQLTSASMFNDSVIACMNIEPTQKAKLSNSLVAGCVITTLNARVGTGAKNVNVSGLINPCVASANAPKTKVAENSNDALANAILQAASANTNPDKKKDNKAQGTKQNERSTENTASEKKTKKNEGREEDVDTSSIDTGTQQKKNNNEKKEPQATEGSTQASTPKQDVKSSPTSGEAAESLSDGTSGGESTATIPTAQLSQAETEAALQKFSDEANSQSYEINNAFPEMTPATQQVTNATNIKGTEPIENGNITKAAEVAGKEIEQVITNLVSIEKSLTTYKFTNSYAQIDLVKANLQKYIINKKTCTESAERASFYCAEGSSPGVKAVGFMMNFGGPILAAISSAQNSCSALSKVANLAAMGLTAAKAICATTKFMCDGKCGKSLTEFANIQLYLKKTMTGITGEAEIAAQQLCPNSLGTACLPSTIQFASATNSQLANLAKKLEVETQPKSEGTTGKMVAGCTGHAQNLAIMAINVIGVIKARESAKKCNKELATTGASELTKQKYCEDPANAATTFCTCEKNPKASGCPQTLASSLDSTKANSGNNQVGTNIKPGSGLSNFAGGKSPVTPASAFSSVTGGGGAGSGTNTPNGVHSASAGNGSGGSGGNNFGGGDTASGQGGLDDLAKKIKAKKWDFGAFGSFGGGGGGSSDGKNKLNGSAGLGEKEMDAIKRKIASEQVASEISTASGKTNWEKVKSMYLFKDPTFLGR